MKRYQLHQDIISPFLINNLRGSSRLEGYVNKDNEVVIDDRMKLKIVNDTIPENTIVFVYLDSYIYCNTQQDLEDEKEKIKLAQKAKEQQLSMYEEKERKVATSIVEDFFKNNQIDYNSYKDFFDKLSKNVNSSYYQYKRYWHNFGSIEKEESSIHYHCQISAKNLFVKNIYQKFNLKHHIAYAYSPRENVGSGGKDHIVLEEEYSKGRLKRISGDPLCKPARDFWGLENIGHKGTDSLCHQCFYKVLRIVCY